MEIEKISVGKLGTNCYILQDNNEGVIIDPGDDAELLIEKINKKGIELKYIILTHGHFDHIMALKKVKDAFSNAKVVINKNEKDFLTNNKLNLSWFLPQKYQSVPADILVSQGDEISFGNVTFKVIDTPGHSIGSMCLLNDKTLISGDTLFKYSIGRCDHPTGSINSEVNSIINKLFKLDDNVLVYPGHGETTSIGFEKENNDVYNWVR